MFVPDTRVNKNKTCMLLVKRVVIARITNIDISIMIHCLESEFNLLTEDI